MNETPGILPRAAQRLTIRPDRNLWQSKVMHVDFDVGDNVPRRPLLDNCSVSGLRQYLGRDVIAPIVISV